MEIKSSTILKSDSIKQLAIIPADRWVEGWIVHDDAAGPYRLLPNASSDRASLQRSALSDSLLSGDSIYHSLEEDARGIIVPLPEKVFLLGVHVDSIASKALGTRFVLQELLEIATSDNVAHEFLLAGDPKRCEENPLVINSFFISSAEFKRILLEQENDQAVASDKKMSATAFEMYQNMRMPHYIWVSEISTVKRFSQPNPDDRLVLGEVILDTTGHRSRMPMLAVHVPGVIFVRKRDAKNNALSVPIRIPADRPHLAVNYKVV